MIVASKDLPIFKYQFLPADRFPLGSSLKPHPWLAFETDSLDACTTIYPRTTKETFREGEPSDLGVLGHTHPCSINQNGYQYLRDCATVISKRDFTNLNSQKKGCSGESEQTRKAVLKNLKKLSEGQGQHETREDCPIGAIVTLKQNSLSHDGVQGLVVDHWKKAGGSTESVVLLALVTSYSDASTGHLKFEDHLGNLKFVYPGLQFLAFRRGLQQITPTGIKAQNLQMWPISFESQRSQISQSLGLHYVPAIQRLKPSKSLAEKLEQVLIFSTSPRFHQTTGPSLSTGAAIRTIGARDFRTAIIANSIAAKSSMEKEQYIQAMNNLTSSKNQNSDNYISRKAVTLLPMTRDVLPAVKPQVPKPIRFNSIKLEFLRSEPKQMTSNQVQGVKANLIEASIKDKNLRFLTYVSVDGDEDIVTSYWQLNDRIVEVRHIEYQEEAK